MKKLLIALTLLVSINAAAQKPQQYIDAAREGLAMQTAAHQKTWRLGSNEHWDVDMDAGTLTFTFPDGVTAVAPIQVVGTYNQKDGSFLWGWDHPSVPVPLRKNAALAREWGEKNRVAAYTTRKVQATEDEAWSFSAVANRLGKGNGVYRGVSGSTLVFMTFGEVALKKK